MTRCDGFDIQLLYHTGSPLKHLEEILMLPVPWPHVRKVLRFDALFNNWA